MKFFATVMGAALVATGASAQQAAVKNNCASPIYVQSFPFDGSAAGPLTTLQPGQSFEEDFRPSGSVSPCIPNPDLAKAKTNPSMQTVKVAKTKTLTSPLFFGYSFSSNPDYAYCMSSSHLPIPSSGEDMGAIQANILV